MFKKLVCQWVNWGI